MPYLSVFFYNPYLSFLKRINLFIYIFSKGRVVCFPIKKLETTMRLPSPNQTNVAHVSVSQAGFRNVSRWLSLMCGRIDV